VNGIIADSEPVAELVAVVRDPVLALRNVTTAVYSESTSSSLTDSIIKGFKSIRRPRSSLLSLLKVGAGKTVQHEDSGIEVGQ
jgi:hypothetical protein